MADPSIVQSKIGTGSGSSMTLSYDTPPSAGNILVAWAFANDEHVTGLSCNDGGTVNMRFELVQAPGLRNHRYSDIVNCVGGVSPTTWTLTTDGTDMELHILEINVNGNATPFDDVESNTTASTGTPSTPAATPTTTSSMAISAIAGSFNGGVAPTGSWTEVTESTPHDMQTQRQILTTTSNISGTWTCVNFDTYFCGIVVYKNTAAAPPTSDRATKYVPPQFGSPLMIRGG